MFWKGSEGESNNHSLNEYKKVYYSLKNEKPDFTCRNEEDKKLIVELIYL